VSDDGYPDARLSAALADWQRAPGAAARARVLAALSRARVFLALSARATATDVDDTTGLTAERSAEMALLSLVGSGGGRALVAFADGHAVQRWRGQARPVPVPGPQACAAALEDGAAALLLDPHGAALAVAPDELQALAAGRVPVPGTSLSTRHAAQVLAQPAAAPDAALLRALGAALGGEPVRAARLLDGPDGPVLGVVPARPLDPSAVAALAARVAGRLGAQLPPEGLDLTVVPAEGPGLAVPLRRRRLLRR
jgi:prepilin-type processing-associated H-X9-DG protein